MSRARYESAVREAEWNADVRRRETRRASQQLHNLSEMRRMYDALLEKYHELASRSPALAPSLTVATVEVPQPDVPPSVVLAAMQRISPTKDKAFEANWAYWEANKEHALAHPDAFADEILRGVEYDRPTVELEDA